jgi:hypothetical protein
MGNVIMPRWLILWIASAILGFLFGYFILGGCPHG